jgi:hypothetical protein
VRVDGFGRPEQFLNAFLYALNGHRMFIPIFVEQGNPAPKDEALDRQTRDAFLSHLRGLTDAWIKTGRSTGDTEDPSKRKLTGDLRWVVNEWWARNRPDVTADASGEPVLLMPACKLNFSSPVEAAKEEAIRQFAGFLDFPHRYQLCKCRSCGEYYYTERRPRGLIEHGTYCPRHRQLASAHRSNQKRRIPIRHQLLDRAAELWGKWPKRLKDDGERATWIAEKLNKNVGNIKNWPIVHRNWVSLRRAEIERRYRRLPKHVA